MFKERYEEYEVYTDLDTDDNVNIYIKQRRPMDDNDDIIVITPFQVESFIASIKRAEASLNTDSIE